MILHLNHAAQFGHYKAYLRTVDTDVVVVAISSFAELSLSELLMVFHVLASQLGPELGLALPLFHALTTSQFVGVGKKTVWEVWRLFWNSRQACLQYYVIPTAPT
ncbi:hypothetical protein Hamer_G010334 [Homarus americanus]|uniref:Uncharacterized protein n=1 Tax=Homarus americanus TaxID=6706 RepID=A0A8J5MX85_HOMAM|nr:hypothetical protein Hamer_G010334 [Homarus americanus]